MKAVLFCHDRENLVGKSSDGDDRSYNEKGIAHISGTQRVGPKTPTHPLGNDHSLLVYVQADLFF
jgi:hypothetical protein